MPFGNDDDGAGGEGGAALLRGSVPDDAFVDFEAPAPTEDVQYRPGEPASDRGPDLACQVSHRIKARRPSGAHKGHHRRITFEGCIAGREFGVKRCADGVNRRTGDEIRKRTTVDLGEDDGAGGASEGLDLIRRHAARLQRQERSRRRAAVSGGVGPEDALDVVGAVDDRDTGSCSSARLRQRVELFGVDHIDVAHIQKIEDLSPNAGQRMAGDGDGCRVCQAENRRGRTRMRPGLDKVGGADLAERVGRLSDALGARSCEVDPVAPCGQRLDGLEEHQPASVHRRPGRLCRHDENAKGLHSHDLTGDKPIERRSVRKSANFEF